MLESNFRKVTPYVPGAQPRYADMIKLNTNENPYPPAPAVRRAAEAFDPELLRLYPPTDAGELRSDIAAYHGMAKERVFVGVGSDDVISVIFQTCFNSGEPVLFPEISYSFYEVWAQMYGLNYRMLPLKEDFTIDPADYSAPNGGVIIANPNAPTGIALGLEAIETIVRANPDRCVVIDEAYVDFGGETALPLLDAYPNLIVVRTFSKSRSMAGLRIGYALAAPEVIRAMEDIKASVNSYTMNWPSICVGRASLAEEDYFRAMTDRIRATRARLTEGLTAMGFRVLPSSANFVFASHKDIPAEEIFRKLMDQHIFVRYFNKPLINNFLRITVGTDEQTDKLFTALKKITQ